MLDRRGFLKFVGGAAVGTLATPVVWQGLDDLSIWTQNWPWIPTLETGNQENTYLRTVSKLCPSAVGTRVRLVGGRPVRVLGDAESPLSRGGVSALAIAELKLRYSPARLKRPLKRTSDGALRDISWAEAEKLLVEKLGKARKQQGIVCLSGDENGSMNEVFSGLIQKLGANRFFMMPSDAQATAVAWKLMGGRGRVGYDFAKSDCVLAIGANVLESWGTVVANRGAWGEAHPAGKRWSGMKLFYAGAVQNSTAAGADMWLPIKPATELALCMGFIHQLLKEGVTAPLAGLDKLSALAEMYTPEKVCAITGLMPDRFQTALERLTSAKAPLVIVGSSMGQGGGAAPIMAGLILNALLGRLNEDGGLRAIPVAAPVIAGALDYADMFESDWMGYTESVLSGKAQAADVLMVYEANPVYALPENGKRMEALIRKTGFSVAFTSFLDETAAQCDLVLPIAMGLERYDDVAQPFGFGEQVYALAQPVVEPLHEARPAGEVLLGVAEKLGVSLGVNDVVALLQAKADSIGADWSSLSEGTAFQDRKTLAVQVQCRADILAQALKQSSGMGIDSQLRVAFVNRRSLGTPETAIPPGNTNTITRDELLNNVLVARVNKATGDKFGLREGALVSLSAKAGSVTATVQFFEGVVNDTVALTMGFGHTAFGAFNQGKGMNVMTLLSAGAESGTGLTMWDNAFVNVVRV